MVLVKTAQLTGAALDWAVAKCEYLHVNYWPDGRVVFYHLNTEWTKFAPSTNWSDGGPIVSREHINLRQTLTDGGYRTSQSEDAVNAKIDLPNGATVFDPLKVVQEYGPTDLIAAMRCYVASKVGDEIEIPFDLVDL